MKTQELRILIREEIKRIVKENNDVFYGPDHTIRAKKALPKLRQILMDLEEIQSNIEQAGPRLESIEDIIDSTKEAIKQINPGKQ